MRFSAILLSAGFIALAAAQSTATTTSLSPVATCLAGCDESDSKCQAACVGVPSPDEAMVNATNQCVAACPQGNGTAEESEAYSVCITDCIDQKFFSSSSIGAAGTATATATGTGTAATGSGSSDSDSETATGTGSSASASGTSGTSTRSGSSSTTGTETANASATAEDNAAAGYTVTGSFIAIVAVAAGIIVL